MAVSRRRGSVATTSRASHWRTVIAKWSRSGLSQRKFCDAHGIPAGTFSWWKYHLSQGELMVKGTPTFVPVRVRSDRGKGAVVHAVEAAAKPGADGSSGPIEVVLPGDILVRVQVDCDEALLARVLAVLRGVGC